VANLHGIVLPMIIIACPVSPNYTVVHKNVAVHL